MMRPFGFFVHHQGGGHARRCAAIVEALPHARPVTIFCARPDLFDALPDNAMVVAIPSLFEASSAAAGGPMPGLADWRTPRSMHVAPLGWPGISRAVAQIAMWFADACPALFVVDVSAELAQMARIASVPAVKVVQHGDRWDDAHMAAYESCVGLLAPFAPELDDANRPSWMKRRLFYAAGLGAPEVFATRRAARALLGIDPDREVVLALSGGGGTGAPLAPLCMGARARPDALWVAIGRVAADWHATVPGNLRVEGWREDAELWIAAADVIVGATGNAAVNAILAAGRPYIAIPEWRYFDEQTEKARMLGAAEVAIALTGWPASIAAWRTALERARRLDPSRQRALAPPGAAQRTAHWLETLAERLWRPASATEETKLDRIAAQ